MAKAVTKVPAKTAEDPVEHVIAGEVQEPKVETPVQVEGKDPMYDKIRITIPVELKVAKKRYPPGTHIIERHQLETFLEMVNKKQRANLAIFTGNNYLVEKMVSGALRVTQVEELNSKTLIGV